MCWWRFHLQSQHHGVGSLIRHPRCVANKTPRLPLNTFFCTKTYSVVDAVFCRGWFECAKCVQTCFVYIMVVVVFCSDRIQRRWRVRLPTPRCEHLWRGLSLCVARVKEPLWIISGPDSPEVIQSSWVKLVFKRPGGRLKTKDGFRSAGAERGVRVRLTLVRSVSSSSMDSLYFLLRSSSSLAFTLCT